MNAIVEDGMQVGTQITLKGRISADRGMVIGEW
jgi:hypothetical protein